MVFILTPVLSEPQMKDAVDSVKSIVADAGAKITQSENWGLKKLAYPIQNKKTGFYNLLEFNGSSEVVAKMEIELRRNERVMRFLTIRLDKFSLEYAAKRRKGFPSKKKQEQAS